MKKIILFVSVLLVKVLLFGQYTEQKIIPQDNGSGDFFGRYLCLDQGDLLIGAHQDDENGYASGSVYLYQLDESTGNFLEIQKFFPVDGDVEEFFGYSIDIYEGQAVIGSHHDSDFGGSSGSAFLLKKQNGAWGFDQKILPDDPRAGDEFGKAVGIWDNQLAIGAFLDDDKFTNSGSVYIFQFENNEWRISQEVYPEDAEAYDQFGNFLKFKEDRLLVGVPEKTHGGIKSGCAYVFEKKEDSYVQLAKLVPPDGKDGDEFGQAVEINGGWLAVGAYKADSPQSKGGAVYVYALQGSDWILHQKLVPPDNEEGDHFGVSVSMLGDWLAVGAYFDDDNGSKSGSVYLYHRKNLEYTFVSKIIASDGAFGDAFGAAVDLNGQYLVIGAYADSENGFFSGSTYIYDLSPILNNEMQGENYPIVRFFPTCVDQTLHIHIQNLDVLPLVYIIYDINGFRIKEGFLDQVENSVFLEDLIQGQYFFQLNSTQGSEMHPFFKN